MSVPLSNPWPRLAEHVRACRIDNQLILLDLRRSKYIGIGGPQLAALSATLSGRQEIAAAHEAPPSSVVFDNCLRRLRSQQLLCDASDAGPLHEAPELPQAIAALTTDDEQAAAATDWRQLLRLWRATIVASAWVRGRSLAEIAQAVSALRSRDATPSDGTASDALRAAVASYLRLRPFSLSSHDRCLNDSLTLIHFLATQALFPQWVIGVRVHPFAAHSWVQCGRFVLNDLPEHVRQYRPILVV